MPSNKWNTGKTALVKVVLAIGIAALSGGIGDQRTVPIAMAQEAVDVLPTVLDHHFAGQALPADLMLWNVNIANHLQPQAQGLLFQVPKTFIIPLRTGIGLETGFGLKGDLDITATFENLEAEAPASGPGVGFGLYLHRMAGPNAMLSRVVRGKNSHVLRWNWWSATSEEGTAPCADKAGRLRLKRTGPTLTYLWASGIQGGDFQALFDCPFGTGDIEFVRVNVYTGGTPCDVGVRLLSLKILGRKETNPVAGVTDDPAQERVSNRSNGNVAALLLIGVAVTVLIAFGLWFISRRGRLAMQESKPAA